MLWRVKNSNLYLLGSLHFSDTPLAMSEIAEEALDASETFAFETNLDAEPKLDFASYGRGTKLSKHISADLFNDTRRLWLKLGLNEDELECRRPWFVAFRLMNAILPLHGYRAEEGIDRKLFDKAKDQRRKIVYLESVVAGLQAFASAPSAEQQTFLARVAQHTEEIVHEMASIVAAWNAREPDRLLPVVERALTSVPKMYSAALAGRNKKWFPQLLGFARTGKKITAVVGSLHMVGPGCIPLLFRRVGYECELIDRRAM